MALKTSSRVLSIAWLLWTLSAAGSAWSAAHASRDGIAGNPDAIIDLTTSEGARLVSAQWRYRDAKIVEVDSRAVGADLRASGIPTRALDIQPHADRKDFDTAEWETIAPESLDTRRSTGKLCFGWYRLQLTLPEQIGAVATESSTLVFELVLDDYAEIWVNGKLPRVLGSTGGQLVKGFNAPNRVVLTHDAHPGQRFDIAVFGANGPLSDPPGNFLWVRSATIDVYGAERARVADSVPVTLETTDPALDQVVARDVTVEQIADGFSFTEGPVWVPASANEKGYLLFSDPNDNVIYRWSDDDGVSIYRTKSGYAGIDIGEFTQPGSNGPLSTAKAGSRSMSTGGAASYGKRRTARSRYSRIVTTGNA